MAEELELKSVVPDPSPVRERLIAAGAVPGFRGLMEDRRYDRNGALLEALGYAVVHAIDRRVEVYRLAGATLRLEWFPRMDLFSPDPLTEFVRRFEPRAGRAAVLALAGMAGDRPDWERT